MSSVYNSVFEMSHIPCAHPGYNNMLEDGTAKRNVDGKVISNGISIDGKCHKLPHQIWAITGFAGGVRYGGPAVSTANNVHTATAAARNHL